MTNHLPFQPRHPIDLAGISFAASLVVFLAATGATATPRPQPAAAPPRAHPEDDAAHDHDQPPLPIDFATAVGAVATRDDQVAGRKVATAGATASRGLAADAGNWLIQAFPSVRLSPDFGAELQGGVQRNIPLGDVRGARQAANRAEVAVAKARVDHEALAARLDAARAYFALWTAGRVHALIASELAAASKLLEAARQARMAGTGSVHAEAEAAAALAELRGHAIEVEHALHHASISLARATGLPFDRPLQASGELPIAPLPQGAALAEAIAKARTSTAVRLIALERDASAARAAEARVGRGAWLQLGGWVELGTPSDATLRFTLGWQTGSPSQSAREEAAVAREAARHEVDLARLRRDAEATLRDAGHEVHHSARALASLREHLLPAAERRLALRRAALAAGTGGIAAVAEAERALLQARTQELRLLATSRWAAVRLWLLLQRTEREAR